MAQVGVNPKINLDFATGLRHILRQDPDIIMIGEIRDKETAEIAIQASLTGHLVLSTLHTNDAPSALTRLVEMGTEAYLLSSTVVGVLAQRLVRTICPHCRESYLPTELECKELGIDSIQPFYKGRGCDQCFDLGYKGRHGIYELMAMNHAVKQQILKSADAVELREVALQHGMVPLRANGAQLVLRGITTSAEVLRVTRGYEGE
jgi:general secretion pathway protein E